MRPALIFDLLDGHAVPSGRVGEYQSQDERPFNEGIFLSISMEEQNFERGIQRGPVRMTIAAHRAWDDDRDYGPLIDVLNEVHGIFRIVENTIGSDGVRVTCLIPQGRGANASDEGWKTITKTATYGVLYDQSTP